MLGILLGMVSSVLRFGATISDNVKNQEAKEWAIKNYPNDLTYRDHHGSLRLRHNDHYAGYLTLRNGDRVLQDSKTFEIVHNYSAQHRRDEALGITKEQLKWKNEAIAKGERFCFHKVGTPHKDPNIYRDLQTGNLCYLKVYNGVYYYTDLNGNFITFKNPLWEPSKEDYKKLYIKRKEEVLNDPTIGHIAR